MKKLAQLVICVAVAASTSACFGFERGNNATAPTSAGSGSAARQLDLVQPDPDAEHLRRFQVERDRADRHGSARGSFSATCANDLKLTGTAQGTLSGSTIDWTAKGVANAAGVVGCDITLKGTAEIGVTSIRVPVLGRYLPGEGERHRDAAAAENSELKRIQTQPLTNGIAGIRTWFLVACS